MVYFLKKHSEKAEKCIQKGLNNIKQVKKLCPNFQCCTLHTFTICFKICFNIKHFKANKKVLLCLFVQMTISYVFWRFSFLRFIPFKNVTFLPLKKSKTMSFLHSTDNCWYQQHIQVYFRPISVMVFIGDEIQWEHFCRCQGLQPPQDPPPLIP